MTTAAPVTQEAQAQPAEAAAAASTNGVLTAIPAGDEAEDPFFKRYMSAGPVPAEETLM